MSYHSLMPSVPSKSRSLLTPSYSRSNSSMKNVWQTPCRMTFPWKVPSQSLTTSSLTPSTYPCRLQVAPTVLKESKVGKRKPSVPWTRPISCLYSCNTTPDSSLPAICSGSWNWLKKRTALWKCQSKWENTRGSYSWTQVFRQKISSKYNK